jgi:hypothetical protein
VIEPIEYELILPATRTGEKLAKTVGRILKHTYQAKRLRIEHSKDTLIVKAKVEKQDLNAIRGAVRMTCTARGVLAELHRDTESQAYIEAHAIVGEAMGDAGSE